MKLVERDFIILKEIYRWRVCLGRHIKELVGFTGQSACDTRLKKLIDARYLRRERILYGVPGLYFLTRQGKLLINVPLNQDKIKVEQIHHDIAVIESAIYLSKSLHLPFGAFTTEKELHSEDGFGKRTHRPDYVIKSDKSICVEVELSLKSRSRFEKIIRSNFMTYDFQVWFVPNSTHKIARILEENKNRYPSITIMYIEDTKNKEI